MLDKTYKPGEIEPRIHKQWDAQEAFKCGREGRQGDAAEPYCIVIPPPNVTGSLHMGHALNDTLQDILCRFERMRGKDVLWQPGMDHAGIATQMVVERQMAANQEPDRRSIGREKFIEKVWAWKEESGGAIINQLKRLGASCDWSRERFTMDEGLSKAVLKVFVALHKEGLIYKDKRLVNWDPKFQTAISDLEVVQVDASGSFNWSLASGDELDKDALGKVLGKNPNGHMYHFRYPLTSKVKGFGKDHIVVATTRPETMLGDSGVAVHPEDERYAPLLAAKATLTLPIVGREIPIVADEHSDPEKGTGAVKITPAHDFNDFEVGKRHDLAQINVLDRHANLVSGHEADAAGVPDAYHGMDRFQARLKVVVEMMELGLLEKIEPTTHAVPHGDRSNVVIEPYLTDQWYVDAETLAKPALKAVENGDTRFVPKNWEKTYFEWMRNIQPWCISRQLWWGHQIPAWYGPDNQIFVAHNENEAKALANKHYGKSVELTRDEDVLDTWFSSALWPFSTLGWPDETPELARYYPTSVLITGFDIIFFWIARMMMMGLHFKNEVPFADIYIHALVRDERGQKMSKSKGNVMDPLDIIDGTTLEELISKRTNALSNPSDIKKIEKATRKDYPKGIPAYGADALRFTLSAMAAQGRDIKLSMQRVEGYRNFATKIWNAARFAEMNECVRKHDYDPAKLNETINKWIVSETQNAARDVTENLENYRFNDAASGVYEFVWGTFCDWYLELIKPVLNGDDEDAKAETRATTAWVLDQILKLLHPFMPFITEELWSHMVVYGEKRQTLLTLSKWPSLEGLEDKDADEEINWVIRLVSEVRSVRAEMNIPAGAKLPMVIIGDDKLSKKRAHTHGETIKRLARLEDISFAKSAPKGAVLIVIEDVTVALSIQGIVDMSAEKLRLERETTQALDDLKKMNAKLGNPKFMERAQPDAIEETQARKIELEGILVRLEAALKRIEETSNS